MTKYKLLINPFAELDILNAQEWYNIQKENLGTVFISEIKNTIKRINENPFQFPVIKKTIRKAIVKNFPYLIIFTIHEDLINVFAVFHTSRNPIVWKKQFKQ